MTRGSSKQGWTTGEGVIGIDSVEVVGTEVVGIEVEVVANEDWKQLFKYSKELLHNKLCIIDTLSYLIKKVNAFSK